VWFTLTPLDPDYPRRAKHRFVMEREIPLSANALFDLLGDVAQWPKWFPDMRAMRWISPEPERAKVGALRRADTGSGDVLEHFVVWDRGKRVAFFAEKMTTPLVSTFFEDFEITRLDDRRSKLVWTVAFQPRIPFRPLMFAIQPRFAKMFDDAADALVRYVKARPS
jgi:ribosome-associated toxin RatA of RatAB toxin-antitoxin module